MTTVSARGQQTAAVRPLIGEGDCVFISDDSITSSHTHFFELKMAVSAFCVCVCAHCWWIKTTVADGVSEWEAGKEESRSSHSFVCFSPVCSKKHASISLLLSQTDKNNHCSHSIHTANTNTHPRALLTWLNTRSATCVFEGSQASQKHCSFSLHLS